MPAPSFWLRCEKKQFEKRAALTPTTAKKLIDNGFEITVERDEQRIFDDSEYEAYVPFSNNASCSTVIIKLYQCWLQAGRKQFMATSTDRYPHPRTEGTSRIKRAPTAHAHPIRTLLQATSGLVGCPCTFLQGRRNTL